MSSPNGTVFYNLWDISNLLQDHGLQLVSRRMWSKDPYDSFDFHSLSAIALFASSSISTSKPTKKSHRTKYSSTKTEPDKLSTVECSPETFTVPSNAQARIRRIVSNYSLQVVNPIGAVDLISESRYPSIQPKLKTTKDSSAADERKVGSKGKEKTSFEPDELRWVFWKDKEELTG
ncbi:hypothetical protein BCR35DRAFT_330738 [Leucosporidium creatinivorum]|uniref:Uncharacterized protein n=1 Tax=Leucosporidium creatinivorum TaxID=106004 RepID=A0A1Y2FTM7_9BASI|nr:hypothetical protein BCR35DRAFT_330738 [Leucosporidium creatinivorum]